MNRNFRNAFTLSEVLITIGLIAVVAAFTIPTLAKNYQYHIFSGLIKKTFYQLEDASLSVIAEENVPYNDSNSSPVGGFYWTSAATTTPADLKAFLSKYFKFVKDCSDSDGKCFAKKYKTQSGIDAKGSTGKYVVGQYFGLTDSGVGLCASYNNSNNRMSIFIDVNGPKPPNIVGIDAYAVSITDDGHVVDYNTDKSAEQCGVLTDATASHYGTYAGGCIKKLIQNNWKIK